MNIKTLENTNCVKYESIELNGIGIIRDNGGFYAGYVMACDLNKRIVYKQINSDKRYGGWRKTLRGASNLFDKIKQNRLQEIQDFKIWSAKVSAGEI